MKNNIRIYHDSHSGSLRLKRVACREPFWFSQTGPLVSRVKEQAPKPKTLPVPSRLLSARMGGTGNELFVYTDPSLLISLPRRERK
jgi:hypothetical protein